MSKRRVRETCPYCGVRIGNTKDHVIPKSIFKAPLPSNMITVDACFECNQTKQVDDDYFREWLAADFRTSDHPSAISNFQGPIMRSMNRKSTQLLKGETIRQGQWVPSFTPTGIYVGNVLGIPLEGLRIEKYFQMMVRGLYLSKYKILLPADYSIEVSNIYPEYVKSFVDNLIELGCPGQTTVGNNAEFVCMAITDKGDPGVSRWLLQFYDRLHILIDTEPKLEKMGQGSEAGNTEPV